MTKFLVFAAVLIASILMMLAGGKNPVEEASAKYKAMEAEKKAEALIKVKEDAWTKYVRIEADCTHPKTALKELECRNRIDMQRASFEKLWASRTAAGWIPELK
jgi:hypothetical protein